MKYPSPIVTPLQVIRKSNELIEARYRLSIWEQRLVLTLLMQISPKDEDFKRYKVNITDLAALWQFDGSYATAIYEEVQNAADSLVGRTVQLSDDPSISETVSWLSYVKYKKGSGEVEMEFHSSLKPYLLQLQKHFTQYQLGHVVNFRNQYSIRIYELLKMEVFKHPAGGFTKDFKYEELRVLLGVEDNEYTLFGNFKMRVITPAVEEISAHTDLDIEEVRYGKTGRKITDISFVIKVRPTDEVMTLQLEMEEPPAKQSLHPIIEKLVELGFALEIAKRYKSKYGVRRIERNIAYTLAKQEEGAVKDIPPYLNKAITEDMGQAWETNKNKQVKQQAEQQQKAAKREAQADIAHLKRMAEMSGVPLEQLLPKQPVKKAS